MADAELDRAKRHRSESEAPAAPSDKAITLESVSVQGVELSSPTNPVVFMDIRIGDDPSAPLQRVLFELYANVVPKTAENFLQLCTGVTKFRTGDGRTVPAGYKGARFHRVVPGFVVQGGDYVSGNGTGSHSIYGDFFDDENFELTHSAAGMLSMANSGKNRNGCQFFVTLKAAPALDGKHVVFGRVVRGMEAVHAVAAVGVDGSRPVLKCEVVECGQM